MSRIAGTVGPILGLVVALVAAMVPVASAQAPVQPLIVIDAGHGGVDPGARGPSGTLEKGIALVVAREVAEILRDHGGYDVRLTREADVLVPLRERTRMANRWRDEGEAGRPALFLSIHANAHERRAARGFETYFLSEALTDDARHVAAMENAARRFEVAVSDPDPLRFILTDLRQNHYLRESSDGAALFQDRLRVVHPGPDRGVKQAGFVVLEGAFMPALLVELGFISNPEEEKLLATASFQYRVARQLAEAVTDFFSRPGPVAAAPGR